MTQVITEAAVITCSHGGKVTIPASQHLLTIDEKAVLVQGDEASGTIEGCSNSNNELGLKPCTKLSPATPVGVAKKLQVGGRFVLLQTATGATDSTPPGTWQVESAGQTKLDTM